MSQSDADHNLLVGVLALQLDFVTREQLIAATSAWSSQRDSSLAQILQQQGALKEGEQSLLVALVEKHLARHHHNAVESLASINAGNIVLEMADALGDHTLEETIKLLTREKIDAAATIVPPSEDRFATAGPTDADPSDETQSFHGAATIGVSGKGRAAINEPRSLPAAERFTIIKPFQRGGLGQVSLARDKEVNREVALKEILPKHADSTEARSRFMLEAEITGSLEHPGVVPVYGLGQYADGRPFYAMRFIRGDNLKLAIEEFHRSGDDENRELRFRQLLGRFVDVCQAIEYAHNRCVLHRDLKPGNIMIGKYGETLVVDWGLAKTIDAQATPTDTIEAPLQPQSADASTATQMGSVVGTPIYMSPEQASGQVDILGPATDIYSLGATLFHLLVGNPPFADSSRETLLEDVRQGKFKPPREVEPSVPRGLESICLKAMQREPQQRYLKSQDVAEDVERWLADEPVRAYQEPLVGRVFRWMRKHRSLVVGAAGVLTVSAIALTLGMILLGAANRREQAQRQLAERNFMLAREAVNDYFINVSEDTLLNQSGMQPLRDKLLKQALEYYRKFLDSGPAETELRDEIAQANYYVGRITATTDSPASALPYYNKSIDTYEKLVAEAPSDRQRLYDYGMSLNAKAKSLLKLAQLDEAQALFASARQVRQELFDLYPSDVEYLRTLANSVMNLGAVKLRLGDDPGGLELLSQAQAMRETRLSQGDSQPKLLRDYGMGSFNLGLLHEQLGEYESAFQHLRQAVDAFEKLTELSPDDMESQYNLAVSYRTLGDQHDASDETGFEQAQAAYQRAIELLTTLSVRNPQVPIYKSELANTQINVAMIQKDASQTEPALVAFEKAIQTFTELVEQFPEVPRNLNELAFAERSKGELLLKLDRSEAALTALEKSREHYDSLMKRYPADPEYEQELESVEELLKELE